MRAPTTVPIPVQEGGKDAIATPATAPPKRDVTPLEELRHALGNQGFGRVVQAKLIVGQPGDRFEQEADRVADRVMQMAGPAGTAPGTSMTADARVQRSCEECERDVRNEDRPRPTRLDSEKEATLRAKETSAGASAEPRLESHVRALRGGGQALPPALRDLFEPRFGYDFGAVRLHTDSGAAEVAREAQAHAFTFGRDVVFGSGQFSPYTESGRRLLAHELTHVVQQDDGAMRGSRDNGQAGHHADLPAAQTVRGGPSSVQVSRVAVDCIQRFESYEHVQLGDTAGGPGAGLVVLDCHNRDLPQHASPVGTWPAEWQSYFATLNADQQRGLTRGLTYGEIVALSGDMYSDFQSLNRAPLREVVDLIPRVRSATVTTQQFQAATGGRYLALAQENIGHFSNVPASQRNRDIWRRNHIDAITAARAGNANLAWGMNATGDHFLTDAFSGGHSRVQRSVLHAQGTTGDVTSKVLHDLDNRFGVEMTNDRGDPPWIAYGDEHLNDPADIRNRTLALEAVQFSKQDIADALAQRSGYPAPAAATVFAAERLIPQPLSMTANRWTRGDVQDELKHLAASEAPGIASELTGDDDRVRDWINRMDSAALQRQSAPDVARMLNVLLSGVVSDDDMRAIERLLGSIRDPTVMSHLRAAFERRAISLNDFGFRVRLRFALARNP